jgi:hypothetical protein
MPVPAVVIDFTDGCIHGVSRAIKELGVPEEHVLRMAMGRVGALVLQRLIVSGPTIFVFPNNDPSKVRDWLFEMGKSFAIRVLIAKVHERRRGGPIVKLEGSM